MIPTPQTTQIKVPYNFQARWYQAQIWNHPMRNKVLVIHRKAGKTSIALNYLIYHALLEPNRTFYYVAPTQRQAKDIVWKSPEMLNRYLPPGVVDKTNEVELTIYFKNGSQIHIKGGDNPDSLRGMNPYGVILDEYAQMRPELWEEVLQPSLAVNKGFVWFMGTPKGKNDFYKKVMRYKRDPSFQFLELKASESKIVPEEVLESMKGSMSEQTYQQEMECEFLEGSGTVFRRILNNATALKLGAIGGHQYIIGCDLARHVDFTVLSVFDLCTHKMVWMERFNEINYSLQKAKIEGLARRYNKARIRLDVSNIGDPVMEDLEDMGLDVEAFTFTNNSKKQLIQNLMMLLEQDRIKVLKDEVLLDELASFGYEMTNQGNIKYGAPAGLHDDCVISLALAVWELGVKQLVNEGYGMSGGEMMGDDEKFSAI